VLGINVGVPLHTLSSAKKKRRLDETAQVSRTAKPAHGASSSSSSSSSSSRSIFDTALRGGGGGSGDDLGRSSGGQRSDPRGNKATEDGPGFDPAVRSAFASMMLTELDHSDAAVRLQLKREGRHVASSSSSSSSASSLGGRSVGRKATSEARASAMAMASPGRSTGLRPRHAASSSLASAASGSVSRIPFPSSVATVAPANLSLSMSIMSPGTTKTTLGRRPGSTAATPASTDARDDVRDNLFRQFSLAASDIGTGKEND
jgi:hypothetical protein